MVDVVMHCDSREVEDWMTASTDILRKPGTRTQDISDMLEVIKYQLTVHGTRIKLELVEERNLQ